MLILSLNAAPKNNAANVLKKLFQNLVFKSRKLKPKNRKQKKQVRKNPHTFTKGYADYETAKPRAGTLTAYMRNGKSATRAMPDGLCKGLHKRPPKRERDE